MKKKIVFLLVSIVSLLLILGCGAKPEFNFSNDQFIETYQSISKSDLPSNVIVKNNSITLNDGSVNEAVYMLSTLEKILHNNDFILLADHLLDSKGIYSNELISSNVYVGISAENESNIKINILPKSISN